MRTAAKRANTTTPSICKRPGCYHPLPQIAGHRKREYCSNACRQQDYRQRKQENSQDSQQRIAELEDNIHALQARLKFEERLRTDVKVRHFKTWLRKQPQPEDSDFYKRFLADTRLPQHASRALYEAKLRASGYSLEDIHLFRDAWLTMLIEQS